jgi:NADH-quinone oxidoreductase subunit H
MGDPLLVEPIDDWVAVIAIVIGKVLIAFVLLLILTMLMIWFERKLVSAMHNRIGPSLAGPWGIL